MREMNIIFMNSIKKIVALTLLLVGTISLTGQDITGTWNGDLAVSGTKLKLVFHIDKSETGYVALMDSPSQGAKGIPASSVLFDESNLSIEIKSLGVIYKGAVVNETTIEGTFSQSGMSFPLSLTRGEPEALKRPQEPKPPFPYKSEDVSFPNEKGGAIFAGTITLPEGKGPFPAAILVSGSGAQNRDEEILGHKPFLLIADYLTRNGIAVLRYDDRGFGESTGDRSLATMEDYMEDALSAFEYLSMRPEIDRKNIGIIGHSEGGTISFMAAARNKDIAFIVSLAGMAVRGDTLLAIQNYDILIASGISKEIATAYRSALEDIYSVINARSHSDIVNNTAEIEEVLFREKRDILPVQLTQNLSAVLQSLSAAPYWRFCLGNNLHNDIKSVMCPVFALNGSKDIQVDADMNLAAVKRHLSSAGNMNFVVRKYEGLNHLFQHCDTGVVGEYEMIEETMSPEVLEDIKNWILERGIKR